MTSQGRSTVPCVVNGVKQRQQHGRHRLLSWLGPRTAWLALVMISKALRQYHVYEEETTLEESEDEMEHGAELAASDDEDSSSTLIMIDLVRFCFGLERVQKHSTSAGNLCVMMHV